MQLYSQYITIHHVFHFQVQQSLHYIIIPKKNFWHHLTFTYQYPTLKLYLNGTLTDSSNTTFTIPIRNITRSINWVGRSNWPNDKFAIHDFDDIKLFDGVLNIAEIRFEMNNNF
jgi:hypothetical protein